MAEISRTTSHSIPVAQPLAPRIEERQENALIQGNAATRTAAPARLADKVAEARMHQKRDPSRPLEQWRGSAEQPVQPMPRTEVMQRAQTTGARTGRLARQAVAVLRRPKGGAKEGYAALRLALSVLDEDIGDDDRIALLTPVGDQFQDAEHLAKQLWDTEDPSELAELLKDALPPAQLRDPQALSDKIKGAGYDTSALMGLLADMQGIPRRIEDPEILRAAIEDEIHDLESSADPTHQVSFFQLAHLAAEQPDPLEFLSTCVEVADKEPSTWTELLRTILRGHPSGASSSESLKGTVHNLILGLGVEMQRIRDLVDKVRLGVVTAQLQLIYTLHSFIDNVNRLGDEVQRSIELQSDS